MRNLIDVFKLLGDLVIEIVHVMIGLVAMAYFLSFFGYIALLQLSITHNKLAIVLAVINTVFLISWGLGTKWKIKNILNGKD